MKCPSCRREYQRQEFDDEERFVCADCNAELVLSPSERLDELRRHGRLDAVGARHRVEGINLASTRSGVSTVPLTLWLIVLGLFSTGSIVRVLLDIWHGDSWLAVATLVTWPPLLIATFVGSMWRRRWGLYLTYVVLTLELIRAGTWFVRDESGSAASAAEQAGAWTANVMFCGIFVGLLVWFVRHRDLFSNYRAEPAIVDDIYTSGTHKNDV